MNTQAISDKFDRSAISIRRTRLKCKMKKGCKYMCIPFLVMVDFFSKVTDVTQIYLVIQVVTDSAHPLLEALESFSLVGS